MSLLSVIILIDTNIWTSRRDVNTVPKPRRGSSPGAHFIGGYLPGFLI